MQLDVVAWVGSIEFLLEDIDGRINPRGRAREHPFDDPSDVGVSEA